MSTIDILAVLLWIVGLFILYLIIRSAIDGSETADNIREIRRILSMQYRDSETKQDDNENLEILDISFDECPACHSKVEEEDKECPSCGLVLKDYNKGK